MSRLNYPEERKDLYDRVSRLSTSPIYKRHIPAPQDDSSSPLHSTVAGRGANGANPDMSFIEITQSQVALPDGNHDLARRASPNGDKDDPSQDGKYLSTQLSGAETLFAVLSSRSDIDHPICSECTSILLASFNARLGSSTRERDAYASFLKSVQQAISSASQTSGTKVKRETLEARNTGESTHGQLMRIENDIEKLEADLVDLEEGIQHTNLEEQAYWTSRNSFDDDLTQITVRMSSLQRKSTHDHQRLDHLQRTNVYNDTFCIGHDGYFGTINGLRLGRLPNQNVDWAEINAAWGQTLLLLATVAERLRYTFNGYRLRPQGSTSRIEKLEYPQQSPDLARQHTASRDRGLHSAAANPEPKVTPLDLFSSGDMAIGRVFNHRKFDSGMVAFLDCLGQLGKYVERTSAIDMKTKPTPIRNPTLRNPPSRRVLPYSIQGDKIGDVSIKLGAGFHQDENFTKACKYALTCCKFLLAHVSNLESQKEA